MLILHFLGLAMAAGTAFAFAFHSSTASKMAKDEGRDFMLNALSLVRMGNIGLIIMFISGGYLMTPYWKTLGSLPLLIAKLVLFLVFGALAGIISSNVKKARKGDADVYLSKNQTLAKVLLVTTVVIIGLAVFSFH